MARTLTNKHFMSYSCWSRVGNQRSPSPLLGGIRQEGSWQYLLKITHSYSFDPEIPLQGSYPRESNDICTKLCIIAFFRIVKDYKQPKCPS